MMCLMSLCLVFIWFLQKDCIKKFLHLLNYYNIWKIKTHPQKVCLLRRFVLNFSMSVFDSRKPGRLLIGTLYWYTDKTSTRTKHNHGQNTYPAKTSTLRILKCLFFIIQRLQLNEYGLISDFNEIVKMMFIKKLNYRFDQINCQLSKILC